MTGTSHEALCVYASAYRAEKCVRQKLQRKSNHTFCVQNFLPGNCAVCEVK